MIWFFCLILAQAAFWRLHVSGAWPLGLDGLVKTDAVLVFLIWTLFCFVCKTSHTPSRKSRFFGLAAAIFLALPLCIPFLGAPMHWRVRLVVGWYAIFMLGGYAWGLRQVWPVLSTERIHSLLALFLLWFGLFAGIGRYMCHVAAPTGDEPHYLMVAHSLWEDMDIDLADDFQDKAYEVFYPAPFGPRPWDIKTESGQIYSWGGWLFPALLALPYGLAGRAGAVLAINGITALGLVLAYLLGRRLGGQIPRCFAACAFAAVTLPLAAYSSLIYPETLAGALALGSLLALQALHSSHEKQFSITSWLTPALLLLALALLRSKYLALTLLILIGLFCAGLSWGSVAAEARKKALALLLILAVYLGLDFFFLTGEYSGRLGAYFLDAWRHLQTRGAHGLLGIWLDQEGGLFFYNLIIFVAFLSLPYCFRASGTRLVLAVTISGYALAVGLYPVWFAEWSYPGRFMTPVIFLLLSAWSAAPARPGFGLGRFLPWIVFAGLQSLLLCWVLLLRPELAYNYADGTAAVLEAWESFWNAPVCRYFPSLIRPSEALQGLFVVWIALFALLCWWWPKSVEGRLKPVLLAFAFLGWLWFWPLLAARFVDTRVIEAEDNWVNARKARLWPDERPYYLRAAANNFRMGRRLKPGGFMFPTVVTDPGRIEFWIWANGDGADTELQLAFDGYERHRIKILTWYGTVYKLSVRVPDSPIRLILRNTGAHDLIIDKIEVHWSPFMYASPPPRLLTPMPDLLKRR